MTTGAVEGLSVALLLASDTGATAAFYRDVLGLPLREEEHDGRQSHYACRLGTLYFTIQSASEIASGEKRGYDFLQMCFTVADLEAFQQRLRERNLAALHPPQRFEHTTFITLQDPDGRHVRIMTAWERE